MGYIIRIGELTTLYSDDPEQGPRAGVEFIRRDDAPMFVADGGDELRPSGTAWLNFCERTALVGLFFSKVDGLMRTDPGCAPLDLTALCCVENVLESWRQRYPDATPNLTPKDSRFYDHDLALLNWLQYWFEWALDDCERPVVANE